MPATHSMPEFASNLSPKGIILTGLLLVIARAIFNSLRTYYKLSSIPTVGPSGFFSSYLGAWKNVWHLRKRLEEGYTKHRGRVFKVAQIDRWLVIGSPEILREAVNLSDDYLSFPSAADEIMNTKFTVGSDMVFDAELHVEAVRSPLTRNIKALFGELYDEVDAAFAEYLPAKDEWHKVRILDVAQHIVCRASNRLFIGLPLCRDPEYVKLNINFAIELVMSALLLGLSPTFLKPLISSLFSKVPGSVKTAMKLVGPVVKERLERDAAEGPNWERRPNDLISWLLTNAEEKDKVVSKLVRRILMVNFGAIHTTSGTFTYAAYNLAAYPEYVEPLREEIEAAAKAKGWSKAAVGKMHKLDSFVKESARMCGQAIVNPTRKVLRDVSFSNGITIPAGTMLGFPAQAMNDDDSVYENASTFDGFRFNKLRESADKQLTNQMANISFHYNLFGFGRHACPGRFFAVNEIKLMLAYMLMHYDIKLEDDKHEPPRPIQILSVMIPDPSAGILFRSRAQLIHLVFDSDESVVN